jgi:predicted RNase H-like HicB family nuclease
MMKRKFKLEYWIDDGWYVGRIKEVPGVFSQGATLKELEENIADAYKMVLAEKDEYVPSLEIKEKEVSLQI